MKSRIKIKPLKYLQIIQRKRITCTFPMFHTYQSAPTKLLLLALPASSCTVMENICTAKPVLTLLPREMPLPRSSIPFSTLKDMEDHPPDIV